MPEYEGNFISAEKLLVQIQEADDKGCGSQEKPVLTILDFRTESSLRTKDSPVPVIKTSCPVQPILFDMLRNEDVRRKIPKEGPVVVVCETGNRGTMVMRYLSQFGFTNIEVLKFGMRGWIKSGYPIVKEGN